jgi:acetoin utilization deacetylase AcuC-like enzyme
MSVKTAWIDAPVYRQHINTFEYGGTPHPESPQRHEAIHEGMHTRGVANKVVLHTPQPVSMETLKLLHHEAYITHVQSVCEAGGGALDAHDTAVVPASWQAALTAAGGVIDAVEGIAQGKWQRAFVSTRPPGHHALAHSAMGFCVFGNVALGAAYALKKGFAQKVAIVDWDVHHGNGTQDFFYHRNDVFVANIHQYPQWPGSGHPSEKGEGAGLGYTLNCPIAAGDGDEAYINAWKEHLYPALDAYGPDWVFISAGFDADHRDPLGGLHVTAKGFTLLTELVASWSRSLGHGRIISVLEGGYSLQALAEDVPLHVESLIA